MQQCCNNNMKIVRNTKNKALVLELIQNMTTAISAPDILERTTGLCDKVTIYRVLDRLIDEGLIHKVVNPTGQILYASCQKCTHTNEIHNHQHVHFSCQKCQTTTCLFQVNPSIQLPDDYLLKEVYLNVTGICPTCNQS
jgi:Fur family ferric uptake transcriptional regulator